MTEWRAVTLGEILSLEYGKSLPERDRDGSGAPVYGSNGVVGYHSSPLVQGPGIVVGRKGTAGSVAYVIEDFFPIDTAYYVRLSSDELDMQYASFLLEYSDLPSLTAQTGVPGLNRERVYQTQARVPSPDEQRRIVDALSAVDRQISALQEESTRVDQLYRASTSLLWQGASGGESELRELGSLMELDLDRQPVVATQSYRSAGVLNAGQGLIDRGEILGSETEYSMLNVLHANQLVMRKLTAWEGPITIVPPEFDGYVASGEFPTFTLKVDVNSAWMRHVCRTRRLWDEMKSRVTGTVQRRKRLKPEQLLAVRVPTPSFTDQCRAVEVLDELERMKGCLDEECLRLQSVRVVLLTSLLSQKMEIPESYDALLEEVS